MSVVKVIKIPKLFQKKEPKSYPMTPVGQVQMIWDIKQEKLGKINGVISIGIILGMFAAGFLGKEFVVMVLAGKGMGKVAGWMIG